MMMRMVMMLNHSIIHAYIHTYIHTYIQQAYPPVLVAGLHEWVEVVGGSDLLDVSRHVLCVRLLGELTHSADDMMGMNRCIDGDE